MIANVCSEMNCLEMKKQIAPFRNYAEKFPMCGIFTVSNETNIPIMRLVVFISLSNLSMSYSVIIYLFFTSTR